MQGEVKTNLKQIISIFNIEQVEQREEGRI